MSIFDEYVEQVATTAINLISDTPDTGKNSILQSILAGTDMMTDLNTNYSNGLGLKMRNMRTYALHQYTLGLPNGSINSGRNYDYKVKSVLDTIEGGYVYLINNNLHAPTATNFAYEFMTINRGWDITDDVVESPPFTPVGVVTFVSAEFTGTESITINYLDNATPHSEVVVINGLRKSNPYYQVSYRIAGVTKYWNYDAKLSTYPELTVDDHGEVASPYMPIIPFRSNNVDMSADDSTPLYKSSQLTLRMIGMDFATMASQIHENPDIGDIDHAFFYVAVDLRTDEQNSINYLHNHFMDWEKQSRVSLSSFNSWLSLSNASSPPPVNTVEIKDSTLDMGISYTYIDTTTVAGNVGAIGQTNRTFTVRPPVIHTETYTSGRNDTEREREVYRYDNSEMVLTRQISGTHYMRTVVHGLYSVNHIYGHLTVDVTIGSSGEEEDSNKLLIPVNVHIATKMGIKNSDRLYYDCVHMICNSYDKQKLKWYETSLFASIIKIVAIIVTIYSLGTMAEVALAAATLGEAAIAVITKILINLSVKLAVDFALDTIGVEAAIILTTALAVYALASSGAEISGLDGLPYAEQILAIMNVMVSEIGEDIGELLEDLGAQMQEFADTQSDVEKELEELAKELGSDADIDIFEVIRLRPNIDLTESPSEFYYRAIHAGNIGVTSLDAIQVYVENKLKLPELTNIG